MKLKKETIVCSMFLFIYLFQPIFFILFLLSFESGRSEEDMFGDVFDILTSLGDFNSFKEIIIAYKKVNYISF